MKTETNNNTKQGHDTNTVLAVSGLTKSDYEELSLFVDRMLNMPTNMGTEWSVNRMLSFLADSGFEIRKAACANGGEQKGVSGGLNEDAIARPYDLNWVAKTFNRRK